MSLQTFVRFDANPASLDRLRNALLAVIPPTRAEPGCLDIHVFEETSGSGTFFIHSHWKDEAAFDTHARLPHTQRFRELADTLVTNAIKAVRTHQII